MTRRLHHSCNWFASKMLRHLPLGVTCTELRHIFFSRRCTCELYTPWDPGTLHAGAQDFLKEAAGQSPQETSRNIKKYYDTFLSVYMLIYAVYFLAVIADCYPWMHLVVSWPWTWPFCTFLKPTAAAKASARLSSAAQYRMGWSRFRSPSFEIFYPIYHGNWWVGMLWWFHNVFHNLNLEKLDARTLKI